MKERDPEDWCFVCKEGGVLLICDHKGCFKSYHAFCVGKDEAFLASEDPWICKWHSCYICKRATAYHCLSCPRAVCLSCGPSVEFVPVRGSEGFCSDCMMLVTLIEEHKDVDSDGEMLKFNDLTTSEGLFLDYYTKVIKDKYGITLQNLQAAKNRARKGKSLVEDTLGAEHDESAQVKKPTTEGKDSPKSNFAAINADNIRLVYLRRTLLEELAQDPETFERKVKGCYVRRKRKPHAELLLVTGAKISKRTRCAHLENVGAWRMNVHVSSRPRKICFCALSDLDLKEAECVALMQKVKDGLISKPTVTELQKKARTMHAIITSHWIRRRLRFLDIRIKQAREKNLGGKLKKLLEKQKLLQHQKLRLLQEYPKVKPEELKSVPIEDEQNAEGSEGLWESVPKKVKRGRGSDNGSSDDAGGLSDQNTRRRKKRRRNAQSSRAPGCSPAVSERFSAFQSKNPFFTSVITQGSIEKSYVCIPKDFFHKNLGGMTGCKSVELRLPGQDRKMPATILPNGLNHGKLSGGWKRFAEESGVVAGNVCLFEWHEAIKTFTVHIYD